MSTLRFIFIAIVLMLLADTYLFGGKRSYIEEAKQEARRQEQVVPPPVRVEPEKGAYFESDSRQSSEVFPETSPVIPSEAEGSLSQIENEDPSTSPDGSGPDDNMGNDGSSSDDIVQEELSLPPVVTPKHQGRVRIAIIIDDLGMDVKRSRAVLDLPPPITLAFLPYGTKTREYAKMGIEKGHELIIHTPMEAMDGAQNIGPGGLKSGMHGAAFEQNFNAMLSSFDGYVGINNHMGSRLTQDSAAMRELMGLLKQRGLFFVDSKTINISVAAKSARAAGVPYAERDVFLDHVESRAFVDNALRQTEAIAARKGYAIAIGHPKDNTIAALREWIPTLAAKGIELVPVSELLVRSSSAESSRPEPVPAGEAEGAISVIEPEDPSASLGMTVEKNNPPAEETKPTVAAPDAPLLLHLPPPTELPAIY